MFENQFKRTSVISLSVKKVFKNNSIRLKKMVTNKAEPKSLKEFHETFKKVKRILSKAID